MITAEATSLTSLQARMSNELACRIAVHLPRLNWTTDQLAAHQSDRLRALLTLATERSPFHARRLAGLDPSRFDVADLSELPTMTKSDMMASFDDVVTDRQLNRSVVEQHLVRSRDGASLLFGDYVCLASGGSSGQRGVFVQTIGEYADHVASILRRVVAGHIASGAPGGLLIGMVAAAAPVHSTGFAAATARGKPVTVMPVPATLPVAEAVARLNELQPSLLVGYPSRLAQLGAERGAGRLHISPRLVISTAEMLTDADRAAIMSGFGVPVVNTFASTEGLVGNSAPGGTELAFASDMCIAELVDEHGDPVPAGTPSAKVLMTNLHNFSQPMIRYELSDSLTACPPDPAHAYPHATVDGRDDGVFRYGPVVIHPLTVRTVLTASAAVIESQVRQTYQGIEVAVVTGGDLDLGVLTTALADSLRRAGLASPQVAVRAVDAVARHPETGKARRFIPLEHP
jgi:phenylacetate-CoA ligase